MSERFGDEVARPERAGVPAPWVESVMRRVGMPIAKLGFRPTLEGLDELPTDRPFLLVANHNAGMGLAEILSFVTLYLQRFGTARPLAGFAHPAAFKVWPLSRMLVDLGAVPSTYEDAAATLADGVPLLVFPGGDYETLRPVWQANRVDFNGRLGFLRVAKKAGVPIVPMGISGSHYTAPMLWRSELLASLLIVPRMLGFKRWGISLLGALGAGALLQSTLPVPARAALAWAWLCSPAAFFPIVPWTIRLRIGAPLEPGELFDCEDLGVALARVEDAVRTLVL
jgi:1-acyl-sn-glycerol-3-phosphate acyltransferase